MMKNRPLIYQAKSFYNAYIALGQLKPPEEDELLLLVPQVVNGAFSVELTIKAILTELGISYSNEHNLKILFEKLPADIQKHIWEYLVEKAPEYLDAKKQDNELLLISDAFVQWRYCYEGAAPALDARFLSAFVNAVIRVMFELGYNISLTELQVELSSEEISEIDKKIENNRKDFIKKNQDKIQNKKGR